MLNLKIEIEINFEYEEDRDAALDRIIGQLKEGYHMGMDRNETSDYSYIVVTKTP